MSSVGWFPWEELPVIELTSHSVLDSITFSIDNSDHDHSDALGVECYFFFLQQERIGVSKLGGNDSGVLAKITRPIPRIQTPK